MHLHRRPLLETRWPVVATLRRSPLPDQRYWRLDLSFVTQLIAMQTPALQQATPSEARAAYRSTAPSKPDDCDGRSDTADHLSGQSVRGLRAITAARKTRRVESAGFKSVLSRYELRDPRLLKR